MAGLLAVLVLCGVGEPLLETTHGQKGLSFLTMAGAAAIVSLAAGELDQLIGLGTETITELDQFSKALLPTVAAATASAGLVGTAAAKQVATVFFCDVLITVIQRLLLPFLYLYIGAAAAGAMLGDGRLEAIAKDFVSHYSDLWTSGKAMFVCLNKVTCVRMYDLVQKYWEEEIVPAFGLLL